MIHAVVAALALFAGLVASDVDDAHAARGKAGPRFGSDRPNFFNGGENLLAWDDNVLDAKEAGAGGAAGLTHLQKLRRNEAQRQLYLHAGASRVHLCVFAGTAGAESPCQTSTTTQHTTRPIKKRRTLRLRALFMFCFLHARSADAAIKHRGAEPSTSHRS